MADGLPVFLAVGAAAGLLAGLFGVGGGLVVVPMLAFVMEGRADVPPEHLMHLALGTSMASIVFTSVASFRAHHARGAVRWAIVRGVAPGIVAGTLAGSFLAARLAARPLKGFFVCFLVFVAWQMLSGRTPHPSRELPGGAGLSGAGAVIGAVSSLVGIGGGTLSVPFMLWCNVPAHHAVGTSAAIGFPIALAGTAGYLLSGWGLPGLPAASRGFVWLPALAGVVVASVLTAPLGARLAHALPVAKLKRAFALLLVAVAARMAWGLIPP